MSWGGPETGDAQAIARGYLDALNRSQAVIAFRPDGTVIEANENFCAATGYRADEIVGQHHRMFVPEDMRRSEAYQALWAALRGGDFVSKEFRRVRKDGSDLWIQASYNPIFDDSGRVVRVVKFATDITAMVERRALQRGYQEAIGRSQAVIAFRPDGTILEANENFCAATGYRPEELAGQHHRIFMPKDQRNTPDYTAFWKKLASGEFVGGDFLRVRKDGAALWLHATYNPVLDARGRVIRVVKFATDITPQRREAADHERTILALAKGRLDLDPRRHRPDDAVGGALIELVQGLNKALGQVSRSSKVIRDSSDQIQRASQSLADSGTRQAASVEEITSSMADISNQAQRSSKVVAEVFRVAQQAGDDAEEGTARMNDMRRSMREIETASESIGKIVKVIDEIAFQTNLLALNAAVEAARAGHHGRGFAVVAEEVRNLAGRSATAAREVTDTIHGALSKVRQGTEIARATGESLTRIAQAVVTLETSIRELAEGGRVQATAVGEIEHGLQDTSDMVQRNAAASEEGAAAAVELAAEAQRLADVLTRFTLKPEANGASNVPPDMLALFQRFLATQGR